MPFDERLNTFRLQPDGPLEVVAHHLLHDSRPGLAKNGKDTMGTRAMVLEAIKRGWIFTESKDETDTHAYHGITESGARAVADHIIAEISQ